VDEITQLRAAGLNVFSAEDEMEKQAHVAVKI
jgi:hypothetical protein